MKTGAHADAGILPEQAINALIQTGALGVNPSQGGPSGAIMPDQIQPASLDLRLGTTAYRLRASFLPGLGRSVSSVLNDTQAHDLVMHEIDLRDGAVLETGCVYLVPLMEQLDLPEDLAAAANPKSSTGRLDLFTRVICDGADAFERIPAGYQGPLYVEIAPRTFSVLARPGDRLVQLRFRRGAHTMLHTQTVSIDLKATHKPGGGEDGLAIIGYRAKRHAGLVDLSAINAHRVLDYWEPLAARNGTLVLDPEEFYILVSKEAVTIPQDQAAEMAPIAPEIGEFRAHYAGFFDPGFGLEAMGGAGARAVLEVRGRDVPFLLRHGQPIAKLVFEPMTDIPKTLYGGQGSHYQAQGLRLSKHFKA